MADAKDAPATETTTPVAPQVTEPYRAYNFQLEIDGVGRGHFNRVSGLGYKVTPIKVREGGTNQIVHMLPGPVEYGEVTLSYGLVKADSEALWTWLTSAMTARVIRKNVSVIILAAAGDVEVVRWNLIDAWPTSWRGAELDALGREIAVESLTLVYESLTRA
jgi:phage tail-like protein